MRKVSLFIATSLDGYIAGPKDEIDWLFCDQDYGYGAFYSQVEIIAMGRRTYDQCLSFNEWPYPGKETYVFTRSPDRKADSRAFFTSEAPATLVGNLRPLGEGKIWLVGGGELTRSFVDSDLVDEVVVSIHPTILGSGIPLVTGASAPRSFKLKSVQSFLTGLVQVAYER